MLLAVLLSVILDGLKLFLQEYGINTLTEVKYKKLLYEVWFAFHFRCRDQFCM